MPFSFWIRQVCLGHPNEEVPGTDPQECESEPRHKRIAQRKRIRGGRIGRREDLRGLINGRVHQHREQQASVGMPIEPGDSDGQRGYHQQVHRE